MLLRAVAGSFAFPCSRTSWFAFAALVLILDRGRLWTGRHGIKFHRELALFLQEQLRRAVRSTRGNPEFLRADRRPVVSGVPKLIGGPVLARLPNVNVLTLPLPTRPLVPPGGAGIKTRKALCFLTFLSSLSQVHLTLDTGVISARLIGSGGF